MPGNENSPGELSKNQLDHWCKPVRQFMNSGTISDPNIGTVVGETSIRKGMLILDNDYNEILTKQAPVNKLKSLPEVFREAPSETIPAMSIMQTLKSKAEQLRKKLGRTSKPVSVYQAPQTRNKRTTIPTT